MTSDLDEDMPSAQETVIILDAGAQYGKVLNTHYKVLDVLLY